MSFLLFGCWLSASHALRVDVQVIKRMRGRHEQPVAFAAAEAKIGAAFRQCNVADGSTLRWKHAHAVELRRHTPATSQIAVDVAAHAVRRAVRVFSLC